METLKRYNNARLEIELSFDGLPYAHTTLIKSLISHADPLTGIVENISYHELSKLLTVVPAPGRKNSGAPEKHIIRSYLRTIEKQCKNDFQIISEHQQLRFRFPNMPAIYSEHLGDYIEVGTQGLAQESTTAPLINTRLSKETSLNFNMEENIEVSTVQCTPDQLAKINNLNIKNKQTTTHEEVSRKKPIDKNFYPSVETIAEAREMGFLNADDKALIKDFINKNTAWGSQFADFNPVYLRFLTKDAERKQQAEQTTTDRSYKNERSSHKASSFDILLEDVRRDNPYRTSPSGEETFEHSSKQSVLDIPTYSMALGTNGDDLRPAFCNEVWHDRQTGYLA